MIAAERTLAMRLGCTIHLSPLRIKLERLWRASGSDGVLEDWLVDIANARGARIVTGANGLKIQAPEESILSNQELVVGILLPQNRDRPQMLRLAAQLISRGRLDFDELRCLALQERCERILAELARQALRIAPEHLFWKKIGDAFGKRKRLRSPLLHYTRLAEPVPFGGRVNAERWSLVT